MLYFEYKRNTKKAFLSILNPFSPRKIIHKTQETILFFHSLNFFSNIINFF